MTHQKKLDEQAIGDIILCDPITSKGREALRNLGLTINDVDPTFFFEHLCVESAFSEENDLALLGESAPNEGSMYYQYSVDVGQFRDIKAQLNDFNSRFLSDSPNQYPLIMLGVAGNGKSIEINKRIYKIHPERPKHVPGKIYIDLEEAFTKITYGDTFECPDDNSLWLFCIKLLDGIMIYIRECTSLGINFKCNFDKLIANNNLATDGQIQLFASIGKYQIGNNTKEKEVFQLLKSFLSLKQAEKDIKTLLETLMLLMYCSAPDQKQYIVFDNIEEYIKLNQRKIQIPNLAISTIYKAINDVVIYMVNSFNRIEKDLGWKAFKIIIVLRRTSLGLLDSSFLQSPVKRKKNIADITGYYQISKIWSNKKNYLWKPILKEKFSNDKSLALIEIVDEIMQDGPQALGADYQSIIAPLMSYGIRRNARAQAHAANEVYEILNNPEPSTIDYTLFSELLKRTSHRNPVRYMFRRALMEIQFKWAIASNNQKRWQDLGIGHLLINSKHSCGARMLADGIAYKDPGRITIMRRILSYLSNFSDDQSLINGPIRPALEMFETVPLYNLVKGVLFNPSQNNLISDNDYIQLARVLIALGDMSNEDTKSAPYVILEILDNDFHVSTNEQTLAKLLRTIYEAGEKESLPDEKYNFRDFGVRITDAGYSFLLDWHASFSFLSSLYCYNTSPLFFLKDINIIKRVIRTVYNAAMDLYKKYENEAARFCGNSGVFTLKTSAYLPKHNGNYFTYKQRMKELHINHLNLYKSYLEYNYEFLGIHDGDFQSLLHYIDSYISQYSSWTIENGAPECF